MIAASWACFFSCTPLPPGTTPGMASVVHPHPEEDHAGPDRSLSATHAAIAVLVEPFQVAGPAAAGLVPQRRGTDGIGQDTTGAVGLEGGDHSGASRGVTSSGWPWRATGLFSHPEAAGSAAYRSDPVWPWAAVGGPGRFRRLGVSPSVDAGAPMGSEIHRAPRQQTLLGIGGKIVG